MSGGFDLQDVTKRPPVTSGDRWKEGQETGWMLQWLGDGYRNQSRHSEPQDGNACQNVSVDACRTEGKGGANTMYLHCEFNE